MPKATSAAEMMAALPNYFVPEQAAGINAVLQLDLSGEGGGQNVHGGSPPESIPRFSSPGTTLRPGARVDPRPRRRQYFHHDTPRESFRRESTWMLPNRGLRGLPT